MPVPANRHIARKLSNTLKTTTEEERRYEEAFRKIGVKLDNLDPKSIIETCLAQDEIRKDLIEKRTLEEERVEDLKKQLVRHHRGCPRPNTGRHRRVGHP